jgi:hypothetical protein
MFIHTLTSVGAGGGIHPPGTILEVPDETGEHLIKIGSAVETDAPPADKHGKRVAPGEKPDLGKADSPEEEKHAAKKR